MILCIVPQSDKWIVKIYNNNTFSVVKTSLNEVTALPDLFNWGKYTIAYIKCPDIRMYNNWLQLLYIYPNTHINTSVSIKKY